MYNPYENNPYNNQNTDQDKNGQKPAAPGYGTGSSPYTAQTGSPAGGQSYSESAGGTAPQSSPAAGTPSAPAGMPGAGSQGVPVGSPYTPRTESTVPSYSAPQAQPGQTAQSPMPGVPQSQARTAYTWNPQGAAPQPAGPYYTPVQQAPKKKKEKKRGAKFGVKVVAAVLACAVVSFSSVGVFALMIQNGVVDIKSRGDANKTAAFTLYKQEDSGSESTPTVTGTAMTAQEVAKKLIPSVVCVQNYQITQQNGFFFGGTDYGSGDTGSEVSPVGEGSGIIISKDGYIVTNQHVIDGATSIKVVTSEGLTYEAELVGEDTQTDLAVIKITTEDELTPAEFGSSENLEVADEVMAIGNPGGLQLNSSVTMGYISALNRQVTNSDTGYTMDCIQTDAAINPGNSGGALVDMNGHVVGINSSKIVATGYEGLGFAIPSDTVQPIVSDLIEFGYVKDRAMLGISGQYIDRMTASFYGLTQGFYVEKVSSEAATRSGLQRGDVITAIDDTQVTSASTISSYIANKKPGDTVKLTVDRALSNQQGITVELVLSENTGESN